MARRVAHIPRLNMSVPKMARCEFCMDLTVCQLSMDAQDRDDEAYSSVN
jgi:hypothetical protein